MIDPKYFDELASKLASGLPSGLQALKQDMERNFRAVLESGISRLDLVTREDFDVQGAVLARTRERLQQLETRVAALEQPANRDNSSG